MLAGADTVLEIDGVALRLRPSLRAALRLERQFGGFAGLVNAIGEGSVTALVTLAVECGEPAHEAAILDASAESWSDRYTRLAPQLVALVCDLADVDPANSGKPRIERPGEKRVTHAEALEQLFAIATGVLGWSPADAWSATAAEIKAALEQRIRMIRAQAGLPEIEPDNADPFAATLDREGLAALRNISSAV